MCVFKIFMEAYYFLNMGSPYIKKLDYKILLKHSFYEEFTSTYFLDQIFLLSCVERVENF